MQAFEFNTFVRDNVIHIPGRYQGRIASLVRVIVLAPQTEAAQHKKFHSMNVDMSGFVFDREDINEC
jgi:hypothetical protein